MTERQTHVVYKRDRLTYQITKSHTLAPTHSQLPETNKYKHDLALSLRKITLVSWRTVKQLGAKHRHPLMRTLQHNDTNMQIVENAGCE